MRTRTVMRLLGVSVIVLATACRATTATHSAPVTVPITYPATVPHLAPTIILPPTTSVPTLAPAVSDVPSTEPAVERAVSETDPTTEASPQPAEPTLQSQVGNPLEGLWNVAAFGNRITVTWEPGSPGLRGVTQFFDGPRSAAITMFIRDDLDISDYESTLAHEEGHAADWICLTPERRATWADLRGIDVDTWFNASATAPVRSDYSVGAGDWAEGVAEMATGTPSISEYGSPGEAQFTLMRSWLAACHP